MAQGIPVVRWACTDDFKNWSDEARTAEALAWCAKNLKPLLAALNKRRMHVFGVDFARKGDATGIMPLEVGQDLVRRCPFLVELHNVPFDQQREILFYVADRLPNLVGGALDATGNGAYLAEKAAQKYGSTVVEVKLSEQWYRIEMTAYVAAFGDKTILLPADADVLADHQSLSYVRGYIKVPDDHRTKGANGFDRHGDSAIAGALAYFASRADLEIYDYTKASDLEVLDAIQLFEVEQTLDAFVPVLNGGLY